MVVKEKDKVTETTKGQPDVKSTLSAIENIQKR